MSIRMRTAIWALGLAITATGIAPTRGSCQQPFFCFSSCYEHTSSMARWHEVYQYAVGSPPDGAETLCLIDEAADSWLDACEGFYDLEIELAGSDCHPYLGTTYEEVVTDTADCDVMLWLDWWAATGQCDDISAIAEVRYGDDAVFGADLFFNDQWYAWADLCVGRPPVYGTEDVGSVALHEIGHTLVLKHVSGANCSECVMAGLNSHYTGECYRVLGLGDRWGSCHLYGGTGIGDLKSFQVLPGDAYVDASWEMWTAGTYDFVLYAREQGRPFIEIWSSTASGDSFSFRDSEVINGSMYAYILWVDDGFSAERDCTPTGAPPLCGYSELLCAEVSSGIRVAWTTCNESVALGGFDVYRSEGWEQVSGSRCVSDTVKLTSTPIPAVGAPGGSYEYIDTPALYGRKYSYVIKAHGGGDQQRAGPVCNPCWRPHLPLCSLGFAPEQGACPVLCPAGDEPEGSSAPLELVVTVKDSCGFPIEGMDGFQVRVLPSAGGSFGLCCAGQEPSVHSPWVMLPGSPTGADGTATVPIWWGGGSDTQLAFSVYFDDSGILPGVLQAQVRSPDMNGDCVVDPIDFGDFAPWFGSSAPESWVADFNCDGVVDPIDFRIFAEHFGHECGSARTLPIPPELLARLGSGDWSDVAIDGFSASPNTPNPFNPITHISYEVPIGGVHVSIAVFDLAGRRVKALVDDERPMGEHRATWDGTNEQGQQVPSGVYFYCVEAPGFSDKRKMVLIK